MLAIGELACCFVLCARPCIACQASKSMFAYIFIEIQYASVSLIATYKHMTRVPPPKFQSSYPSKQWISEEWKPLVTTAPFTNNYC
jgi:hypothetical protein